MRKLICFAICCVLCYSASAQERSFGTLPLVKKPGASSSGNGKKIDSVQYKKVVGIYNRLVQARGDFRYPVPSFSISTEERRVAGIDYDQLSIVIEEKALGVCYSLGNNADAAIAFLLGHELTHYYEKHAWRSGFAADYKDLKIGIQLDNLADDAANETEADYLGGFLAYSAGYGLFQKGTEIIQSLYKAYGLKNDIPGYPSLSDRQALSRRSAERLARLTEAYDMANLLTAIGKYTEAYEYYRYILMEYQSREIYNNLGVTACLDALQYFKPNELKYHYPIELDLESSAAKGDGLANARDQLLRQAILHFDAAISLDPNYAPAYLNKANAYALLGDLNRARFYANVEARQAAKTGNYPKTNVDVDVLMGIIEARSNSTDKAKAFFKAAETAGSAAAKINNRILLKQAPAAAAAPPMTLAKVERIDSLTLADISKDPFFDNKRTVDISSKLRFLQNPQIGKSSLLFISQNTRSDERIFLHVTSPNYPGKTARNIGLGDVRNSIVSAYGQPERTVETPQGQIMVYKSILFVLGPDGKLQRWANFL